MMVQGLDKSNLECQGTGNRAASLDWAARRFNPLRYQPGGIGNWSGHLPFAYDLVASLQPDLIVELGTHYGESYFGFCQAVEDQALSTRCYAVDTWRGDEQSGFYSNAVYEEVSAYNRTHYASFSVLLRMTFDEASTCFADASIDLLHIDGLHTYEGISHDFFHWLPKVKRGGVILLHDVMGRSPGFGVWRLWEELTGRFPGFAFHHSSGLGVLRIPGSPVPANPLLERLFASDAAAEEQLRRHYSLLAENLEYRYGAARTRIAMKDQVYIAAYAYGDAGYGESQSVSTVIPAKRWQRITLELSQGSRGPVRIDPSDRPAIIEIAEIQVRRSGDGHVLQHLSQHSGFGMIQMNGEMEVLPGTDHFRCASYGFDPQIFLPETPHAMPGQPLSVEIWLAVDTELTALAGGRIPDDLMVENRVLQSEVRRLEKEEATLRLLLNAVSDGHGSLCQQMMRIERDRGALEQRVQSLEAAVAAITETRDLLREQVAAMQDQIYAGRDQISAAEAACREMAAEQDRLRHRISDLSNVLRSEQERNRSLLESWSWRITGPLRWIGQIARG